MIYTDAQDKILRLHKKPSLLSHGIELLRSAGPDSFHQGLVHLCVVSPVTKQVKYELTDFGDADFNRRQFFRCNTSC